MTSRPKSRRPTIGRRGGARPGAGRKAGEATRQVRVYEADARALRLHGRTAAEAVRSLLRASRTGLV